MQPTDQQLVQIANAHRAEAKHVPSRIVDDHTIEGRSRGSTLADRHEDANSFGIQASGSERQRSGSGCIQPLRVVHRQQHRGRTGKVTEQHENCNSNGALVGRVTVISGPQECHLESLPLRSGQAAQHLLIDRVQQVAKSAEWQALLGVGRTAGQDRRAPFGRPPQTSLPDARLPDACVPLDDQAPGSVYQLHQKLVECFEL
jgi:hypothetical protein